MIALVLFASAWAGFGVRSSREPLPSRENERSIVLPKGWTELEVGVDHSVAAAAWSSRGRSVPLDVPWRTDTVQVGVRYGVAPGWELFGSLPWTRATGYVLQTGFGTGEIGGRFALHRNEAPFGSVGLEVAGRVPVGFDGGSLEVPGRVPLTTGTGDLRMAVDARRGMDGLLFLTRVEAVHRFAGRVGWRDGRVKPGDQGSVDVEVLVQAGPLALGPGARAVGRLAVRAADPGPGGSEGALQRVDGSAGASVDVGGRALLHLTRGVELEGRLRWSVVGEDDTFVRLDEVHPAKARVAGLSARVRW
ncbi:MAG: hypothetical protein R3F61_10450 [Myxococcota bacterium]